MATARDDYILEGDSTIFSELGKYWPLPNLEAPYCPPRRGLQNTIEKLGSGRQGVRPAQSGVCARATRLRRLYRETGPYPLAACSVPT